MKFTDLTSSICPGISLLYLNNFSDADTFLQLAARWSQSHEDELRSMNNLGSLHWLQHLSQEALAGNNTSPATSSERRIEAAGIALEYWNEAIVSATQISTTPLV